MNATKQLLGAAVLIAAAGAAFAQEGPATTFTEPASTLSRAEVIADLHLWQRAGVDQYVGVEGADFDSPGYARAMATYQRLRNGPEYLAEVQRVADKRHETVALNKSTVSQN